MTGSPLVRVAGAVALALVLLAVACGGDDPPAGSEKVTAASSVGDCLRRDPQRPGGYLQAGCATSRATVEITDIVDGDGSGPHCPAGTDALADAAEGPVSGGEIDGPATIWCLRNLDEPHPGDPGVGGGELVTGDCFVLGAAGAEATSDVRELPCDGEATPQYELLATVTRSEDCPPRDAQPIEMASPRFVVLCGRSLAEDDAAGG